MAEQQREDCFVAAALQRLLSCFLGVVGCLCVRCAEWPLSVEARFVHQKRSLSVEVRKGHFRGICRSIRSHNRRHTDNTALVVQARDVMVWTEQT